MTKEFSGVPAFVKSVHYMLGGPITLDPDADWFDESGDAIKYAKKGTILGKVTSTGLAVPYDNTAIDGRQTAIGILWEDISFGQEGGEKAGAVFMIHGRVDSNKLIGYDANAAADLYGISFEADDTGAVAFWSKLTGTIIDEDTEDPIVGAVVVITLPDGSTVGRVTDDEGAFEFEKLPYGTLAYSVSHTEYITVTGTVEIGYSTTKTLAVKATKGVGAIAGTLVDEFTDAAIVGAVVKLMQGETEIADTTTDASGEFAFANVDFGNYEIVITATGYEDIETPVSILAETVEVDLVGERLVSTVSGTITKLAGGDLLAGALVSIIQPDGSIVSGVSGADGTYEIEGVKYGELTYWINLATYDHETGTITVNGETETLDKALTASA
jgi:hypothetical protein